MKNPQITLLKKQVKKLDDPHFDLEAWKVSCLLLFDGFFGTNDPKTMAVRELKIDYSSMALRDAGANYQPLETSKKKAREILDLAIDQMEMAIHVLPESELQQLIDQGDKEGVIAYLKRQKKEDLVTIISSIILRESK